MDNLRLSVIAVLLHCNLPGSVGTKSQRILLEMRRHSHCRWEGESFLNCSFTGMSTVTEDASPTAILADFSHNNIKTFLCTDGRKEWALKHLNLSNNLISELSLTTCGNFPVLETLNLNGNAIRTLTLDTPTPTRGSKAYGEVDGLLPALKVLSVESNNLNRIPRGTPKEELGLPAATPGVGLLPAAAVPVCAVGRNLAAGARKDL
ncbi:LOW QUALITY PROTEIN: leucine-rich repeat-containing protein 66-like [Rhynochetos jubatus]